jgi:hypothetical protein
MIKQLAALTLLGIAAPVLPAQADLATQYQQAQHATYENAQYEHLSPNKPRVVRYAIDGGKIWSFTRTHYLNDTPKTTERRFVANLNEVTSKYYDSGCIGGWCGSGIGHRQWKIENDQLVRYSQKDEHQPLREVMASVVVPGAAANHFAAERSADLQAQREAELKEQAALECKRQYNLWWEKNWNNPSPPPYTGC